MISKDFVSTRTVVYDFQSPIESDPLGSIREYSRSYFVQDATRSPPCVFSRSGARSAALAHLGLFSAALLFGIDGRQDAHNPPAHHTASRSWLTQIHMINQLVIEVGIKGLGKFGKMVKIVQQ